MSSRSPDGARLIGGLALAVWLASGCGGGDRARVPDRGLTRTDSAVGGGVTPGISPRNVLGPVRNPHAGDAKAIAAGRQLFTGFNCAGCHSAYGGGGMGPNLRDSLWIYGSSGVQVFSTIAEGRPYGMPGWGGLLPDDQIWMLVSYIETLGTPEEPVKPPVPSKTKVRQSPEPDVPGG